MSTAETLGVGISIFLALAGAFWGLLSILFRQNQERIGEKFEALEASNSAKFASLEKSNAEKFAVMEEHAKELGRLEKEFLVFQRDLPLHYVRREDYVRNQSVIESKLDALALKIENWQLKEVAKNAN